MILRVIAVAIWFCALILPGAWAETLPPNSAPVGETMRFFVPPEPRNWRGAEKPGLLVRIWYPAQPGTIERPRLIGAPGHELFIGHAAAMDAHLASAPRRFSLILLSHGTGGSADSLDWFGAGLAQSGFIVVGLNHPGNTALGALTLDGFSLWWERARDVSDALDWILADPMLGPRVDQARIGAAGFSLGGYTVLELAGARTDRGNFDAFCASLTADAICRPPEMDQMKKGAAPPSISAQTRESLAHAGDSYRDARIKAVFAMAPALGEAFTAQGMAGISVPVALTGGTADGTVPVKTNIARIVGFLPRAQVTMQEGGGHYSFLDECVPAMHPVLPLICNDLPGIERNDFHTRSLVLARDFFATNLPQNPK